MKKIFLGAVLCLFTGILFAQHDHSSHKKEKPVSKEETKNKVTAAANGEKQLSQLLLSYYNIKNALVTGDAVSAALNAGEFLKTVNTVDYKVISEGNSHILAKDAGRISTAIDLKKQREYFINFSSNMVAVAKALKLSDQPVYIQYCPMKKASWLSSEKEIRNPYYGSSMLTCGEVTEILN